MSTIDEWTCCNCGAPSEDKLRVCDCLTDVVVRGSGDQLEQAWKIWPPTCERGRGEAAPGDPLYDVWAEIGRDSRLKSAREKLSIHEIRLIVGHAQGRPL